MLVLAGNALASQGGFCADFRQTVDHQRPSCLATTQIPTTSNIHQIPAHGAFLPAGNALASQGGFCAGPRRSLSLNSTWSGKVSGRCLSQPGPTLMLNTQHGLNHQSLTACRQCAGQPGRLLRGPQGDGGPPAPQRPKLPPFSQPGPLPGRGRGSCSHSLFYIPPLKALVPAGNALASQGGFCAGPREMVDHQRLSGLGYCFSASLPPYLAVAASTALAALAQKPQLVRRLQLNAASLRDLLQDVPGELLKKGLLKPGEGSCGQIVLCARAALTQEQSCLLGWDLCATSVCIELCLHSAVTVPTGLLTACDCLRRGICLKLSQTASGSALRGLHARMHSRMHPHHHSPLMHMA